MVEHWSPKPGVVGSNPAAPAKKFCSQQICWLFCYENPSLFFAKIGRHVNFCYNMHMVKTRVVIVGGGFGGVKAALELSKSRLHAVTLISDNDYFLHHATLYSTVMGRSRAESVVPLTKIFARKNVKIINDSARSIDIDRKQLVCEKSVHDYDKLIVAIGAITDYHGIGGIGKHSYSLRDLSDVEKLHKRLHDELARDEQVRSTYSVIGSGPSGVELAGTLMDYISFVQRAHNVQHAQVDVALFEARERVLPHLSQSVSDAVAKHLAERGVAIHVGERVTDQQPHTLVTTKRKFPTEIAVWAPGTENNPFFAHQDDIFLFDKRGLIIVDEFLEAAEDIFVIGDNASVKFSGLATNAIDNAKSVAKNLIFESKDVVRTPYRLKEHVLSIPIDDRWAIVKYRRSTFTGIIGAKLRRLTELRNYLYLVTPSAALATWRSRNNIEPGCAVCTKYYRGKGRKKQIAKR